MPTAPAIKHPCFAHHNHLCSKSSTSFYGILSHLESGNCRSGITIDRINILITYFPNCKAVINPHQEAWLLAKCARKEAEQTDYDAPSQKWHCPHCEHVSSSRKKLTKHMRNGSCILEALSTQRPDLPAPMEKPFRCPLCNTTFKRISNVLGHAESGTCHPNMVNQELWNLMKFLKAEIGRLTAIESVVAESGKSVEDHPSGDQQTMNDDCKIAKISNCEQAPPTERETSTNMRPRIDVPIEVSDAQLKGYTASNTLNHLECTKKWPEHSIKKKMIPEADENQPINVMKELRSMDLPNRLTVGDTLKILTENEEHSTSGLHQLASVAGYRSAKLMEEVICMGVRHDWTATEICKELVRKGEWSLAPALFVHGKTLDTRIQHIVDETDDSPVWDSHSSRSHQSDDPGSRPDASSPTRQNRFDRDHIIARSPLRERPRLGGSEDEHVSTDDDEEGGVAL
ncbi:MAG: hypothetical protein Q9186_002496 [Xanthomendoza sp. 1 TL-2023]